MGSFPQSDGQIIIAADSKRRYEQGGDTLLEATGAEVAIQVEEQVHDGDQIFKVVPETL